MTYRRVGLHVCALFCIALLLVLPAQAVRDGYTPEADIPDDRPPAAVRAQADADELPYILDTLKQFTFGSAQGSDCWGWTNPQGQKFAFMGSQLGISVVDVTNLALLQHVPGTVCTWQDFKTYQHYLYAVSECGSGLRVYDLQYLPDSITLVDSASFFVGSGSSSSHNISIDTVTGYLYAERLASADNAVTIVSLADPASPLTLGSFGPAHGIHDLYAHNDTVFLAEGTAPYFSIWDLADKLNPECITRVFVPNAGYVHNVWPTPDGRFAVTTEETSTKTVKIWNIEDFDNIQLVAEYLGPSGLAHNAHIEGDKLYLSHYESGVRVLDLSAPNCPDVLAAFDTYPEGENASFDGCWGIYPHAGDSIIYASNIDGRFSILELRPNPAYVDNRPDSDGDGLPDECDNCLSTPNADQVDGDNDGIGDVCDVCPTDPNNDFDGDGLCAEEDNCPFAYNPDQTDTDGDGKADACDNCPLDPDNDADGDGICASDDNCPELFNTEQHDSDGDGIGNGCDPCPGDPINDPDEDGLCAGNDNCPFVYNPDQLDSDADGHADVCDNCPTVSNPAQADTNGDGVGDACCCVGTAGDINGDGVDGDPIDLSTMVDFLFSGGAAPYCTLEGDVNGDGTPLDPIDLSTLVDILFGPSGATLSSCQ